MYAPGTRSALDALRAELASIWAAPQFDPLAYAQCVRALEHTLLAQGRLTLREKRQLAGRAGARALHAKVRT